MPRAVGMISENEVKGLIAAKNSNRKVRKIVGLRWSFLLT